MKKVKLFTIMTILVIISLTGNAMANTELYASDEMSKESLLKAYSKYLHSVGYDDELLESKTVEELRYIINNGGKLESKQENYTLFITSETTFGEVSILSDNAIPGTTSYTIPLSDKEYKQLSKFKDKKELTKYLNTDDNLKKLQQSKNNSSISIMSSSNQKVIDQGVLMTSIDVSDISTTTDVKKQIGFNWHWTQVPYWKLTDGVAWAHTAGSYLSNYQEKGGYVRYITSASWGTVEEQITPIWEVYGLKGTYNVKMGYTETKGRIWARIGNAKTVFPTGYKFTVLGQYGHKEYATGINVSIGNGSISMTPTLTGVVTKSDQVWLADITTN